MSKGASFPGVKAMVWCVAIASVAFLLNLGNVGLIDETEPLFAEAARVMKVTGDWITPYYNGETRFDKPPLVYWGMAIGYHLLGVNEWAVRLPSALGAMALTCICYYTYCHFQTQKAWILPGILCFNLHTIIWARTGVSDMLLSACMGGALFCFFWGYTREKQPQNWLQFPHPWYLAFYILLALAVLTKGPVGIVLPGLIILAFLVYLGELKVVMQQMGVVWGLLIFLAISVPWYILVILRHGNDYINSFFGYHNLERFTSVVNRHSAPWYFYFLILLLLFAPWSTYLPAAIAKVQVWRRRFWLQQSRQERLNLFAFFWLVSIFLFFSVAVTKLPSYILPVIPAAGILVTSYWQQAKPSKFLLGSIIANIILVWVLAIACWLSPKFIGEDPAVANLPQIIGESGLPQIGAVIWGLTGLSLAILLLLRQGKYWRQILAANLIGFIFCFFFLLTPAMFLVDQVRQLPLRELAVTATTIQRSSEEIIMLGFEKPTIVFYSQTHIHFFRTLNRLEDYLQHSNVPETVLIITRPKRIEQFEIDLSQAEMIAKQEVYWLFRIPTEKLSF